MSVAVGNVGAAGSAVVIGWFSYAGDMHQQQTATDRWREMQEARGLPPEILSNAPESPWKHDPQAFRAPETAFDSPSRDAALALLEEPARRGRELTVLDVGCGGGSASLAVADHADLLVGVDHNPGMLDVFSADCAARGVGFRAVLGEWPSASNEAGIGDVVLCHHVGYNTPELAPFVVGLTVAARRGVVMELTERHPMAWLDPLWLKFHDFARDTPATADDAVAVLQELGITPSVTRWARPARLPDDPAWVTKRLCLPPERVDEVADALSEIPPRPRGVVTLSW